MTRVGMIAVVCLLLALPGVARAQIAFAPCGEIQCGRVTVPLDRSGAVPGTLSLGVYRAPARTRPARGVLVGLPGGPGDSGRTYFLRRLRGFDAVRRTHDLVFVDPRGTGASGALRCSDATSCAETLGPASALYTSRDVADDVEAVRAALGVEQVALYGISYGTWFAQTYAKRHPTRVSALVLDGAVSLGSQDDAFRTKLVAALPRALRAVCARSACRGITADAFGDATAVLRTLERGPVDEETVDATGRSRATSLDVATTALAVSTLDINPPLRAELPAAVAAARGGDTAPLARLVDAGLLQPPEDPAKTSNGANVVTQCEELGLPWARTSPFEERIPAAERRLEAMPAATFEPIGRGLALLAGMVPSCERWPARPEDPLERGSLPAVRALVLSGEADLRTPYADAVEVARDIAGARLELVRNTGHGALVEEPTGCASRLAASFLDGERTRACPRVALLPRPRFPRTLARVPGRTARDRVVAAAVMTATDALNQSAMRIDSLRERVTTVRFGGLRGGRARGTKRRVVLIGAEYVPGVAVSGTASASRHDLRIRGPVNGSLRVRGRRVTGTLGGRRVAKTIALRPVGAAGVRVADVL